MRVTVTMVTMRERNRLDRRADILEQATRIVGERGYHGFGIQELAQRCGLTKAGLLHHFPSKDALLVAVLRDRDRMDEIAIAGQDLPAGSDPRSSALAALRAIVARNATRPELVRLYAILRAEALDSEHPAYGFFKAREAATLELFAEMIASFRSPSRSIARRVLALMIGLELQWLREDMGFDLIAEWDLGIATLLA